MTAGGLASSTLTNLEDPDFDRKPAGDTAKMPYLSL